MRFSLWMYVWRHLTSNRLRLWLTGAAIAIGVASISSMLIIANSGMRVMSQPGNTFGATDIIVRLKAGVDPDEFAAKIKTIPRVTTVLTEKTWPLGTDKIAGKTEIRLMLRGVEHQEGQPDRAYYLKKGRLPSRPGEVALSADFAKVKKLGIGDNYRPKNIDTNLTIVGLTADGQDVSDGAAFVYVPLTYFNSHFSGAPALGELKILVNSAADQPIVKKDIQRRLSDAGSVLTRQEFQESSAKNALMTEALFGLFGAIALFVGALLIYTTFSLTAAERVREYAILRAIGGRRLHIRRLVYGEALLLGLTFSVIGLVLGAALSYLLLWLSLRTGIISGMSFSDLELRPAIICVSVLSGVAVTWLSALGPARRASRTTPMTGIRVEKENLNRHPGVSLLGVGLALIGVLGVVYFCVTANPEGSADAVFIGAAGVFAVLIGFALAMPIIIRPVLKVAAGILQNRFGVSGKMSALNLARTPARSGHTATMILVGVSLIIGVATISAGAVGGGEQIFKRQVKYDLVISQPEGAPVGVSEETLDKIRGLDGIDAADGFNFIDSESGGERLSMAAFEPGEWRHLSSLFFRAGRGWVTDPGNRTWRALQDGGIFVGSDYAKQRNLRVGDYLSLQTDTDGRARFKIAALVDHFLLGSSQMTSSNMVFMSRATAKTYFSAKTQAGAGALNGGTGTVYELMIKLKSGVDRKTVSAEIKELLDKGTGLELVTDEQVHEHLRRLMRGPDTFIILIFAISIIVGLLGVVNTVAMSVFQRYRELGLLRAVGASAKQLRKMVLLETVLLVLIGVFFGVLLGTVVSAIFVAGIGSIEFAFPFVFPWLQVLILILLVLAAGLAAGLYPARLAVRIPITDALRYE